MSNRNAHVLIGWDFNYGDIEWTTIQLPHGVQKRQTQQQFLDIIGEHCLTEVVNITTQLNKTLDLLFCSVVCNSIHIWITISRCRYVTPTKLSDAQPAVEQEKQFKCLLVEISRSYVLYIIINISCPRKRIKNWGMSCNLLRVPTFMV